MLRQHRSRTLAQFPRQELLVERIRAWGWGPCDGAAHERGTSVPSPRDGPGPRKGAPKEMPPQPPKAFLLLCRCCPLFRAREEPLPHLQCLAELQGLPSVPEPPA